MLTIFELKQITSSLLEHINSIKNIMHIDAKKNRLTEIENQIATNTDWSDIKLYASLSKEKTFLSNIIADFTAVNSNIENLNDILQLPENELDNDTLQECEKMALELEKQVKSMRIKSLFTGKTDNCNAFLEINSGAGGTESNDWAEMLLRMYLMWADGKGFKSEIIDKLDGEEAGIKSAVVQISGDFAYGLLKNETGTHRLVRISPFNANGKRQTSFAGVFCYPEVNEDIEININPADLRIDVYRSSGAGGQHVNKTDSAIRITYLPTGLVVACQDERSQIKNKAKAMKVLRAKLYEQKMIEQEQKMSSDRKQQVGSGDRSEKIRTYNFPQNRITDHRIGFSVYNITEVMDGDLTELIEKLISCENEEKLKKANI